MNPRNCIRCALIVSLFASAFLEYSVHAADGVSAFPGAEGPGAWTPGGRGGKVYLVTTLEDYVPGKDKPIPGSLRGAVEAEGPRMVVFRVAGYAGSGNAEEEEHATMNYVANYLEPGPSAPERQDLRQAALTLYKGAAMSLYVEGNHMVGFEAGTADNWRLVNTTRHEVANRLVRPAAMPPVTTDDADTAYKRVLAHAGAILPKRDAVDSRIIEGVSNGTGRVALTVDEVGGWPELKSAPAPEDFDSDGMPDVWEQRHGLNHNDASDSAKDNDGDLYTNIEECLNGTDPNARDGG